MNHQEAGILSLEIAKLKQAVQDLMDDNNDLHDARDYIARQVKSSMEKEADLGQSLDYFMKRHKSLEIKIYDVAMRVEDVVNKVDKLLRGR